MNCCLSKELESVEVRLHKGEGSTAIPKSMYHLLGFPPNYICIDLTLNSIPKVLRAELRVNVYSFQCWPLGDTNVGMIQIALQML